LLCYEDDTTNRLTESLNLFKELTKYKILQEKIFVVIFTKGDLLLDMINEKNSFIKLIEMGFKKKNTYQNIVEFHKNQFLKSTFGDPKRILFFDIISLPDKKEFKKKFNLILDELDLKELKHNLE
jgi:hypothetical protein